MLAHTTAAPPRPSAFVAGIPPALDAVVLRAMAKLPGERFATAHEMLDALEHTVAGLSPPAGRAGPPGPGVGAVRGTPSSEPPPVVLDTRPAVRRKGRALMLGLGVGGAGLVGLAVVLSSELATDRLELGRRRQEGVVPQRLLCGRRRDPGDRADL